MRQHAHRHRPHRQGFRRLRTLSDRTTDLVKEPVAKAFERLREDLRPLTRYSGIEVDLSSRR